MATCTPTQPVYTFGWLKQAYHLSALGKPGKAMLIMIPHINKMLWDSHESRDRSECDALLAALELDKMCAHTMLLPLAMFGIVKHEMRTYWEQYDRIAPRFRALAPEHADSALSHFERTRPAA